jgi:hypothetical protein
MHGYDATSWNATFLAKNMCRPQQMQYKRGYAKQCRTLNCAFTVKPSLCLRSWFIELLLPTYQG